MRYSNAIFIQIPEASAVKFDDKKSSSKINLDLAREQQKNFMDTLQQAGVNVVVLAPSAVADPTQPKQELINQRSLLADDSAIVIKGTALLGRLAPSAYGNNRKKSSLALTSTGAGGTIHRSNELAIQLCRMTWQVVEAPSQINGKAVVLEGSDVFFTGREIFVGIRKGATNMEGALIVAKTFADYTVVPIQISSNLPLKYYISMASDDVIVMSDCREALAIRRKIEREANFRYKVLTIPNDLEVNCISVNNSLIFHLSKSDDKKEKEKEEIRMKKLEKLAALPCELWSVDVSELVKLGTPFSRFCLLIPALPTEKQHQQRPTTRTSGGSSH